MVLPILLLDAPHARATLRVEVMQAQAGRPFLAAVEVETDPHWHVYWKNPGDSGVPTSVRWSAPKGWRVEPLEYPAPRRFAPGGIAAYGYEGKTLFLARITPSARSGSLSAKVKWLVCADACIAGGANPAVGVKVGPRTIPGPQATRLRGAANRLPRLAEGWTLASSRAQGGIILLARPPKGERFPSAEFFPSESGLVDHAKPAVATLQGAQYVFKMEASPFPEPKSRLNGVLVFKGAARPLIVSIPLDRGNAK